LVLVCDGDLKCGIGSKKSTIIFPISKKLCLIGRHEYADSFSYVPLDIVREINQYSFTNAKNLVISSSDKILDISEFI
jgi:hypothetical protein